MDVGRLQSSSIVTAANSRLATSSATEDGKDLTEYLDSRLAPCWLGRPYSRKCYSGIDQYGKPDLKDAERLRLGADGGRMLVIT